MVRFVLIVSLFLSMFAVAVPGSAQETTPGGPNVGEAAKIYAANGEPVGEVTVTKITDPFEEYAVSSSPPPRGYHWAMVAVSLTAGSQPLPVNYSGFQMVDSDGYVSYQTYVSRDQASMDATPDLSSNQVEPGQIADGVIFFQVFGDSTISVIEYAPSYEQSIVVADLRASAISPGDSVVWMTGDETPLGELTVAGIVDPLQDYNPSSPPQRGFRYVGVAVSFTNLGETPTTIDSYRFSIIDHEGFVNSAAGISRTQESTDALPDLAYTEVAPGATLTVLVTFQLINAATIKDVLFAPQSDRKIRIAEFAAGATYDAPDITPVATVAADPACVAVLVWGEELVSTIAPLSSPFELVDMVSNGTGEVTPTDLRNAAKTFKEIANSIEHLDTPAAAQATSEQFSSAILAIAEHFETLANNVEENDAAAISDTVDAIYEQAFGLTGGAYSELAAMCPAIEDL